MAFLVSRGQAWDEETSDARYGLGDLKHGRVQRFHTCLRSDESALQKRASPPGSDAM